MKRMTFEEGYYPGKTVCGGCGGLRSKSSEGLGDGKNSVGAYVYRIQGVQRRRDFRFSGS